MLTVQASNFSIGTSQSLKPADFNNKHYFNKPENDVISFTGIPNLKRLMKHIKKANKNPYGLICFVKTGRYEGHENDVIKIIKSAHENLSPEMKSAKKSYDRSIEILEKKEYSKPITLQGVFEEFFNMFFGK